MLHQIGTGTLGPVFRTYEPTRDRLVAVKVFRLDIVPEQAQALAAALSRAVEASLFHPSIVEPLAAGVEGTLAYRAEEYVAAESLDVAMRHYAPAPIEKALPFITQLAGAIDFARTAGIGHGGLHPRDIFVTPDEARATGFGVVEALEQVGIRAPIRRPYSAPERIDGSAWSTPADVFSLAAITFELLTGKRPAGTGAQIGALPQGDHTAALLRVLARAMDEDPAKRYASALAFAGALEAASQGRPLTDAVSQVVAIADAGREPSGEAREAGSRKPKAGSRQPAAASRQPEAASPQPEAVPLVLDLPPVEPIVEAQMDVHDPEPIAVAPAAPAPVAQTPETAGEFAIEARLDPVHEALEDAATEEARHIGDEPVLQPAPPALFADVDDEVVDVRGPGATRFAGDFVEEQEAESDTRSPLEDEPPDAPARLPAEAVMFHAGEAEADVADGGERGRPAILPYALVGVLGLLVGFAGGYFVGNRERLVPPQDVTQNAAPAAAPGSSPAAGPATPDQARQYSEQKVAPPPSTTPPARTGGSTAAPARPAVPPTRREPLVEKGSVIVRSLPSHAGVTINGTWRGRTPITIDDLAFGSYTVRVVQPGYVVAREEVTLNARTPAHTVTARLERAGPAAPSPAPAPPAAPAVTTGSLYVNSRPSGASVTVDGRRVGQTPVSVLELSAGSHTVRIEMEGKKPVTATPRVAAGKMERVTVSLEDK